MDTATSFPPREGHTSICSETSATAVWKANTQGGTTEIHTHTHTLYTNTLACDREKNGFSPVLSTYGVNVILELPSLSPLSLSL